MVLEAAVHTLALKGALQRLWRRASYEQVRRLAEEGRGLEDLERVNPQLARKLRVSLGKMGRISLAKIRRWLEEANPELTRECLSDPVVVQWLAARLKDIDGLASGVVD